MKSIMVIGVIGAWLLIGAATSSQQADTKKYTLSTTDAVGDKCTIDSTFTMKMKMEAPAAGQDLPEISSKEHKVYTVTVLAVNAKRNASTLRQSYQTYRADHSDPTEPGNGRHSLEGKTVILRQKGDKTVVTVQKGAISAEDRKELESAFDKSDKYLPDHPVAVGDAWDVDAATLSKQFRIENGKASMHGTLAEALTYRNHPCLRLHYDVDLEGPVKPDDFTMHAALKLDVYYALDLHRPIRMAGGGPLTMHGTTSGVEVNGTGAMDGDDTYEWSKVDGVSLAAAKRPKRK